jgi:tetratricopeptide (TPR) repeat protein
MANHYIVLEIDSVEHSFSLEGLNLTLGRHKDNTIVFDNPVISARHGRLFNLEQAVLFEDLYSTNGTYVDGQFIRGSTASLGDSGRIVFGKETGPEILYRHSDQPETQDHKERLFQKAYTYLLCNDFSQALIFFEHVLNEGPSTPSAYYYAGYAASKLNKLDTAILHMEQYLAVMPRDVRAMVDIGKLFERKGFYAKAAWRYKKALDIKPQDQSILLRLNNLERFEPMSATFREEQMTEDILGANLIATVETKHFTITYNIARHGRKITDALKVLEESYHTIGDHLGFHPEGKVPVVLETEESALAGDWTSVVGTASIEGIHILVTPTTMTEELFLYVQLTHEYVHYLIECMNPDGQVISWWLHEGLAQYESQNLSIDSAALITHMLNKAALIPMQVMHQGILDDASPELVQLAYAQAFSMVEYCVLTYGWDAIAQLIRALAAGKDIDAYRQAGIYYEKFEEIWHDWFKDCRIQDREGRTKRMNDNIGGQISADRKDNGR